MLDVHVPEHKLHGVRDFAIHLLTITVGLLIALGLENTVEALHHRHQREEAEANIRQELEKNRILIRDAAPHVAAERNDLVKLARFIEQRASGQPLGDLSGISVSFNEQTIPDAAWRTASSTGVLTYMDYGTVEKFADAYKEQDMLQKAAEQALDDYLEFTPIFQTAGKDLSPEQARDALPLVRRTLGHVNGVLAVGEGTLASYDTALK